MPIPLGVLAQAGAGGGGAAGAFDWLETQTITNTTTDVVTFSSLNSTYGSTYQHLMFRINAKAASVNGNTAAAMRIYMNGIGGDGGGSSYATHLLRQINSSGQQSQAYSSTSYGYIGFSTAQFGNWGQYIVDILDPFETTKNTTVRSLSGNTEERFGDFRYSNVGIYSTLFNNTAAITSVSFQHDASLQFESGSRISMYGLRSA
jgi:hypothetical protein